MQRLCVAQNQSPPPIPDIVTLLPTTYGEVSSLKTFCENIIDLCSHCVSNELVLTSHNMPLQMVLMSAGSNNHAAGHSQGSQCASHSDVVVSKTPALPTT